MPTPNADRAARLLAAKRSPELATLHDRSGWLALYSRDAAVEDPVGSPACARGAHSFSKKADDLESFYEAFIAPVRSIRAEERGDFVVGDRVLRDVVLHVTFPGGATSAISAVLEYELVTEDGALRVRRMRAYWDAQANARQLLSKGWRGQVASAVAGFRLVRAFGRDGVARHLNGTKKGIRREGVPKVEALAAALASNDAAALDALATSDASVVLPGESPKPLRAFDARALGLAFEPLHPSGFVTVARITVNVGGAPRRGVAFVEFERESKRVERLRLYWEAPAA